MKVDNLILLLGLDVFTAPVSLDKTVRGGYTSDLLNNNITESTGKGLLWITMQTRREIVAVSLLKDISAIVIVGGGQPDDDTLKAAEKEGVAIFGTTMTAFELSGKMYGIMQTYQE